MKRRAILLGTGGALVGWVTRGRAQATKLRRIAFLHPGGPAVIETSLNAFRSQMAKLGYREGQDLSIEVRWANGATERLPALAAELTAQNPEVILTATTAAIAAARKSTSSIPIVFATSGYAVEEGLIASLQRPGGNITGVMVHGGAVSQKLVEMAREMFPGATRLALLVHDPDPVTRFEVERFQGAARQLKFEPLIVRVARVEDLERAFRELAALKVGATIVPQISFFGTNHKEVFQRGVKAKLPLLGADLRYADAGALMSYGNLTEENYRRAAVMVDKILRGAKPGELPVEQPERLQVVLNLRTAKAIGVSFPPIMKMRADRSIE